MIRAGLYIRVSTQEQALHGLSIESQKDALIKYAKDNGYMITDIYIDAGITARKRADKREDFQRLLKDVKENKIDIILVTKLDRWFRNIKDYYVTQEILEKHNCNWKTIFERYDTSTASGRLLINIMLAVAQDECDRTSERIKAVFSHKRELGEIPAGNAPFGYYKEKNKLLIDEEKAPMIKEIFNHYNNNGSLGETSVYISSRYRRIDKRTIKGILKNERYIGRYNGVCGFNEPLVSDDLFFSVQEKLKINRRYTAQCKAKMVYVFTGIIYCGYCDSKMVGATASKYSKEKGHYKYPYYKCNGKYLMNICTDAYCISEKLLEDYLLSNLKKELKKYKMSVKLTKRKQKDNSADIKKLKDKLSKIQDLYIDNMISKEDYREKFNAISGQIATLENTKEEESQSTIDVEKLLKTDFNGLYKNLTNTEKRNLWISIIDKIIIKRDDIKIIFK